MPSTTGTCAQCGSAGAKKSFECKDCPGDPAKRTQRFYVCNRDCQKLFWKTAKHLWNADLLAKMSKFDYIGSRDQSVKVYQTLDFVEGCTRYLNIDGVSQYNHALGTILRWLRFAVDARKRDIGRRLLISRTLTDERNAKVQEEETRM